MALNIDDDGTIYVYQGDSGDINVKGLRTDNDYVIYFAVKNDERETIGSELSVHSNYQPNVQFVLTSSFTNLLSVPSDDGYAVYYYGLKACANNIEDTLFVANTDYGQLNKIIVYPKQVEGV